VDREAQSTVMPESYAVGEAKASEAGMEQYLL